MSFLKIIFLLLILIFLAMLINIEVTRLRIENKKLLQSIYNLEEKKAFLEDNLAKRLTLIELERRAKKIGLVYPEEILRIKINGEKIVEIRREKYLIQKP